jgi:DNA-binding NtrC family response regulator
MATILCVGAEPSVGTVLEHTVNQLGHRPILVSTADDAVKTVAHTSVDLIVADYMMPDGTGLDLLRLLHEDGRRIPVIIMTEYSSIENAVSAIKGGAFDYLIKPVRAGTAEIAISRALELIRLRQQSEAFRPEGLPPVPIYNLDELERRAIERALAATGGNRTRAAKLLGISERTLRNKLNGPKAVLRT